MSKKRKVGRGEELHEATTKGSAEYMMRAMRSAFYRQRPDTENEWYIVEETCDDHIIVYSRRLTHDEFYYVTYSRNADGTYALIHKQTYFAVSTPGSSRTYVKKYVRLFRERE